MANVTYHIYNRINQESKPASGYCLPFEKFRFEADFTGVPVNISDKKVIWNFGDDTSSNLLTAYHDYSYPGYYPVSLTVFDSGGNGSISTYLSGVRILNAVEDLIILTTNGVPVLRSGQTLSAIYVSRYNSYQTTVSGDNRIINLAVSGNKSPLYSATEYNADKYAHLIPSAKFKVYTENGLTVVDSVTTTNEPLYAVPSLSALTFTLGTSAVANSYLAGSRGYGSFYYVEDFKF